MNTCKSMTKIELVGENKNVLLGVCASHSYSSSRSNIIYKLNYYKTIREEIKKYIEELAKKGYILLEGHIPFKFNKIIIHKPNKNTAKNQYYINLNLKVITKSYCEFEAIEKVRAI